ncbi:MAG: hypothetical protein ACXVPE_16300 [Bacteroidia bacterium]
MQKDLQDKGLQNIMVYISRTFSLIDFINQKIISLKGTLFGEFETEETLEAFSIKLLCDWEWFIERTLINCLIKDTTNLSSHLNIDLPKTITHDVGFAILNGTNYFDIKSTGNLKGLAKNILVRENNPFVEIKKDRCNSIDDFYIIRNYIAHKSEASKRSFKKLLLSKHNIKDFIEPGKFLLKYEENSTNILKNNFNVHACGFWVSALDIWEFLFPNSYKEILDTTGEFTQTSMNKLKSLAYFREPLP